MTDNPPRNGASLLLRSLKIFTPVATGVVLILIGYWLNSWLSRDHLSIEYVRFIPSTEPQLPAVEIDRKMHQLRSLARYQFELTSGGGVLNCSTINPGGNSFYGSSSSSLTTGVALRSFQTCLEGFNDEIKMDDARLLELQSDLNRNPGPLILQDIFFKWTSLFSPRVSDPNIQMQHEKRLQIAKHEVAVSISDAAQAERLITDLLELAKQVKIHRTGNLTVVTRITNTGDTDGLVMDLPQNSLILNKNSAKLPLTLVGQYNPYNYQGFGSSVVRPTTVPVVSIPKREAGTIAFLLDPSVLPEPPRVAISELLKQSQYGDLRGRVILKDTRNNDFESKEFDFPPGPEE